MTWIPDPTAQRLVDASTLPAELSVEVFMSRNPDQLNFYTDAGDDRRFNLKVSREFVDDSSLDHAVSRALAIIVEKFHKGEIEEVDEDQEAPSVLLTTRDL